MLTTSIKMLLRVLYILHKIFVLRRWDFTCHYNVTALMSFHFASCNENSPFRNPTHQSINPSIPASYQPIYQPCKHNRINQTIQPYLTNEPILNYNFNLKQQSTYSANLFPPTNPYLKPNTFASISTSVQPIYAINSST